MEELKKQINASFFEKLSLFTLACYLVKLMLENTMFDFDWPLQFVWILRMSVLFTGICRMAFFNRYEKKEIIGLFLLVLCCGLCYIRTGHELLIHLPILMIGTWKIRYRKILHLYLWCSIIVLGTAVLGSFCGVIPDLIYMRGEQGNDAASRFLANIYNRMFHLPLPRYTNFARHSFGVVCCTDFAAWIYFLSLTLWLYFRKISGIRFVPVFLGLAYFVYYFAGARNSSLLFLVTAFVAFLVWILECLKGSKLESLRDRLTGLVVFGTMPVCTLFGVLVMTARGGGTLWKLLHKLLGDRLLLSGEAFRKYGWSLLGNSFRMSGNGGTDGNSVDTYNFLDISYCLTMIRYGLLMMIVIAFIYTWVSYKEWKKGQIRSVFVIALMALHGLLEHHIIEPAYACILLLPLADFQEVKQEPEKERDLKKYARGAAFIAGLIGIWGSFYGCFSAWRTLCVINGENAQHARILFVCYTGIIILGILMAGYDLVLRAKWKKSLFWYLAVLLLTVLPVAGLKPYRLANESELSQINAVLEELVQGQEKGYRLCSDEFPYFFRQKWKKTGVSLWYGNANVGESDIALLVYDQKDLYMMVNYEFSFAQLTEHYGIYTNSYLAKEILQKYGYELSDVCNAVRRMDLTKRENGLYGPMEVGLGREKRKLEASLELAGFRKDHKRDEVLCVIRIKSEDGERVLYEKEMTCGELEKQNGRLDFEFLMWYTEPYYLEVKQRQADVIYPTKMNYRKIE